MHKCKALLDEKDKYEHIMRALFDFSLIGYYIAGGREGGADYVWKYKDQRYKFSDNATQFRVHPGFKDVFGLKKFRLADRNESSLTFLPKMAARKIGMVEEISF
jgi:hypothetical protein